MREFYEFDEERYQRKSRIKIILVAIIFTLIGIIYVHRNTIPTGGASR